MACAFSSVGCRIDRCSTNDILPTVLEMAGLSDFAPEHLDGVSLDALDRAAGCETAHGVLGSP